MISYKTGQISERLRNYARKVHLLHPRYQLARWSAKMHNLLIIDYQSSNLAKHLFHTNHKRHTKHTALGLPASVVKACTEHPGCLSPSEGRMSWGRSQRPPSEQSDPQIVRIPCELYHLVKRFRAGSPKSTILRSEQPGGSKPTEDSRIPMEARLYRDEE